MYKKVRWNYFGPRAKSRREDACSQTIPYLLCEHKYVHTYFFVLSTNRTKRPVANDIPPSLQILVSRPTQHLPSRERDEFGVSISLCHKLKSCSKLMKILSERYRRQYKGRGKGVTRKVQGYLFRGDKTCLLCW